MITKDQSKSIAGVLSLVLSMMTIKISIDAFKYSRGPFASLSFLFYALTFYVYYKWELLVSIYGLTSKILLNNDLPILTEHIKDIIIITEKIIRKIWDPLKKLGFQTSQDILEKIQGITLPRVKIDPIKSFDYLRYYSKRLEVDLKEYLNGPFKNNLKATMKKGREQFISLTQYFIDAWKGVESLYEFYLKK